MFEVIVKNEQRIAHLEPIHDYAYRRPDGEIPIITGVVMFTPYGWEERPCVRVQYLDGFLDYIPLSLIENKDFRIV